MAADLAELTPLLPPLCQQLEQRLQAQEPFRALQQLALREAGGHPVEAIASAELRAHLEGQLRQLQDYRVLALLRTLVAELDGTPLPMTADGQTAAFPMAAPDLVAPLPLTEPVIETITAAAPEPTVDALPPLAPPVECAASPVASDSPIPTEPEAPVSTLLWQSGDLHLEASEAVASAFGGTGPTGPEPPGISSPLVEIVVAPPAEPPLPVLEVSELPAPPAAETVITPPSAPLLAAAPEPPTHVEIAAAEATVMASLAKLRAAEEAAARAAALAALAPVPTPRALSASMPSASMEGTMANVAAAVAATVAAAGRIAEPKLTPRHAITIPAALATQGGSKMRERPPPPAAPQMAEATEIRFVERPASPMLDIAPRVKPVPLAVVSVAPIATQRPAPGSIERASRDWEEAVVEFRRAAPDLRPEIIPAHADPAIALVGRAGHAFGRFVKTLKGEKA